MSLKTYQIQRHHPDFLLFWAKFFSKRKGTCYLRTGMYTQYNTSSFLFLCPEQEQVDWNYISNSSIETNSYPMYGALSYEFGSPYKTDRHTQDPFYALFSPSIWAIECHTTQTLTIAFKEQHDETILQFFDLKRDSLSLFLQGQIIEYGPGTTTSSSTSQILSWEKEADFCDKVRTVQRLIYEGDVYQLNISYEVTLVQQQDPWHIFEKLIQNNPSPQSAFLRINDSFSIVSSSPERLLKRKGTILLSQPIKGTKPRGFTKEEDHKLREELCHSEKERSELAMITDLIRNDLFHISIPGTTKVERTFHIDAYESVFQQSSFVTSCPNPSLTPFEALVKIFPGGSITGCPKERAMQRIHEIENRIRGIYTGSIGYILSQDEYDWNIAIRTLLVDEKSSCTRFSVGSGIVWDSDPLSEYKETLHKAKSLVHACSLAIP